MCLAVNCRVWIINTATFTCSYELCVYVLITSPNPVYSYIPCAWKHKVNCDSSILRNFIYANNNVLEP
jgi:hypothetical protein